MKIAIISDHIPSKKAHSINTMNHAQAFFNLGHEIEILIVRRFREDKDRFKIKNVHDFYAINRKIKLKYFRDYSPYYFKQIRFLGPFLSKSTNLITNIFSKFNIFLDPERRISSYCKENKKDLTFCRRTEKIAFYNILNKIPTFIDLHNFTRRRKSELKNIASLKKNNYLKGIITIHKNLKNQLIELGFSSEKILVEENAISLIKYDSIKYDKSLIRKKLNLPENKKIILYIGRLDEKGRGIDVSLKAAKSLNNQNLMFYFIGGSKKQIKYWKNYCIKEKIIANINFLKWIENALVPYYLKAADILLAPYSLKISTAEIMSPLKLFEYMASNVPIIASNVQRIKEICNDNECLLFNADDSSDLINKIKILLENEELRETITKNAYYKSHIHSFSTRCKKILELIK